MILLRREPFRVATARMFAGGADTAPGLVCKVSVRFENWLNGVSLRAEAFIDPGADTTLIRASWIRQCGQAFSSIPPPRSVTDPHDPDVRQLEEGLEFQFGSGPWLTGPYAIEQRERVPGHEDILLGRDFLTQNGLLLVIDGETKTYSLLYPNDDGNKATRERIRRAISDDPQL